jgi:hypothetical protein
MLLASIDPQFVLQGVCEGSGRQETGHHLRGHERLTQGDRPEESQNQHQECWYALVYAYMRRTCTFS